VKKEASGRRAGVDGVGQTLELNSLFLEFANEIDQLLDAPAQPV
jgi:hypothetical protein